MSIPYLEIAMRLSAVEAADIERILSLLKSMGGTYTVIEHAGAPPAIPMPPDVPDPNPLPPHVPPSQTLPLRADAGKTHQDAINLFDRAFGRGVSPGGSPWYIQKIIESGLSALGIFTLRSAPYLVPPLLYIEDMPLSDADKQKLLDALK